MCSRWQVALGGVWHDLRPDEAKVVAAAVAEGRTRCAATVRGFRYDFDLERMTQTNRRTGTKRSLRQVSNEMELDERVVSAPPPQVWKKPKLEFRPAVQSDHIPFQIWLGGRWRNFGRHQARQIRQGMSRGEKIVWTTIRPGGRSVLIDLINLRQTTPSSTLPSELGSQHARPLRRLGSAPSTTSVVDPVTDGICFSANVEDPSVLAFACAVQEWCLTKCRSKFEEQRAIAIERLVSEQGGDPQCVERSFCWKLLPVDSDGWLERGHLQFSCTRVYSKAKGIRFQPRTSEFEVLLEDASSAAEGLFTDDDVQEVLSNGIHYASFSLDPPHNRECPHPLQEATWSPPKLSGTDFLRTLLHADYLLKMLCGGVEISMKPPFSCRRASEGLTSNLSGLLSDVLRTPAERSRTKKLPLASCVRSWIECGTAEFTADECAEGWLTYEICDVEVEVLCECLVGGGPPSADAHHDFVKDLTANFRELASYFPVLGRLVELVRLSAISRIIASFAASLRSQSDDVSLKMLSRLEASGYHLGTASLDLASQEVLSVGVHAGNFRDIGADTGADTSAWVPTAFLSSDYPDSPKPAIALEVGMKVLAMRKDGHWCQATVQAIGTYDVVTISWENGMAGDLKKSRGLLRAMGKIPGYTQPSGVIHGGVKVSGDLQEVKLSRVHQELQKLAPLFVEVAEKRELRPEVLGAIALRESNAGLALKEGWGDGDNAYGIMQVDKRHHNVVEGSGPASKEHIEQAAEILKQFMKEVEKKHPDWPKDKKEQGGIAAYNFGVKNVRTQSGIDQGTTKNNYSQDVLKKATEIKRKGLFD